MQVVGRVSYSWYLWHWPMLILVPAALGHALSLGQNLSVAAISFVVAAATSCWSSGQSASHAGSPPHRGAPSASASPSRVAAVAACVLSVLSLPSLTGSGHAPVASAALRASAKAPAASSGRRPRAVELYRQTALINARSCVPHVQDVPANLEPSLPDADADEPPVFVDGCLDSYTDSSLRPCVFGDTSSSTTVVLFGDSHAAMWFPAVEQAAEKFGWRLITWTKATCPPFPLPIYSPELGRTFTECDDWHAMSSVRSPPSIPRSSFSAWRATTRTSTASRPTAPCGSPDSGRRSPTSEASVPRWWSSAPSRSHLSTFRGCLSAHLTDATACSVPVDVGLNGPGMSAEKVAVNRNGGTYVDTQPWFCAKSTCAVMVDNLIVYRDDNHLTQAYASFLAPAVEPVLQRAIAGEPLTNVAAPPPP